MLRHSSLSILLEPLLQRARARRNVSLCVRQFLAALSRRPLPLPSFSLCLSRVSLIYRACSRFSLRRSPFRDTAGASAASAVLLNFLTEPRREQRHGSSHCPFIKIQIPYYRSLLRPACTKSRPIGFVAASDESAHAFRYKTGWLDSRVSIFQ